MGVDFLDFLRSGEKDIHAFAESRRRRRTQTQIAAASHYLEAADVRRLKLPLFPHRRVTRNQLIRASSRRCYDGSGFPGTFCARCCLAVKEPNLYRAFYLPRLPREYYQGDAVVHWTLPISNRRQGWLNEPFHAAFRNLLLHTAAREGLFCPTYCLMPDHLHLVWMGLRQDSDQLNGMAFLRTHLEPRLAPQKFQHQPHDHVLKETERRHNAFARACHYILENPLLAKLVEHPAAWLFSGAIVPGYPTLHPLQDDGFWPKF
jgi:REP element-mobilizing transposase RayT